MVVYQRKERIVAVQDKTGPVLVDLATNQKVAVDGLVLYIWLQCNGKKMLKDISIELAKLLQSDHKEIDARVKDAVTKLVRAGLLERVS
jgi:hypothetical protein